MNRRARIGLALLGAFLALASARPGAAGPSDQVPIGPRAIGMGGAFTSIADDASALFWNPAGLARVGHQEISASHATLFGADIQDNVAAFVVPLSLNQALAMDWYHSGFDDNELGFTENRVTLGAGFKLNPWLWGGVNGKLLTRDLGLDGSSISSGHGFGMDVGLLALPADRWRAGIVLQDLTNTGVRASDGSSETDYRRNLRLGGSYSLPRLGTAAVDVDDRWHLGVEATPHEMLALRAGVEDDRHGVESATWSFGVGIKAGPLRVDWARVMPPTLANTDHFGLALEFNFNPAQVHVEKVQAREIYTSLYKSYAREDFGTAELRNLEDRPLTTRVSIFAPELMSAPSEQDVTLRPKAVNEVPLTAVLDQKVLAQRGDQPVEFQITASYPSKRLMRREKASARTVAYAPGAIDWGLGMAQAAAWVTPRDPAVDELARQASRLVLAHDDHGFGNRNLSFAATMTDALAELGVAYVPDPNNPFATISSTPHAVDTIHYPYQTLDRLSGDCDDTTVLMASMLANVGVNTAFVDVPGHIFLIVDAGLSARNRDALGVDSTLTVTVDDEVWIPLETTSLSRGFTQAWRDGADEIASAATRGPVGFVDVGDSQIKYEPVLPPGDRKIRTLDDARFDARLDAEAKQVAALRDAFYQAHYGAVASDLEASAEALMEVARVELEGGDAAGARTQLAQALAKAPNSAAAHNNLGVVLSAMDSLDSAVEQFRTALALGHDAGIALNPPLARWAAGDSAGAIEPLRAAIAAAGGEEAARRLLGVAPPAAPNASGAVSDAGSGLGDRVHNLLQQAALAKPASPGTVAHPEKTGQLLPERRGIWKYMHWIE
ncbi:MAG TPA: hypothetical protein VMJ70_12395 [Candidatus Sulfotelmatobacter sp.]|nr:hypothetical protein [Candidatus Sulfotelmatobacter sp.]